MADLENRRVLRPQFIECPLDFDLYLGDVDPNGARPVPPIRRPTLSQLSIVLLVFPSTNPFNLFYKRVIFKAYVRNGLCSHSLDAHDAMYKGDMRS